LLVLLLAYCVVAWATWFGGTLYQMLVVVPIWAGSPPDSLRHFFEGTPYNRTILRFFGPRFMAARCLPAALALAVAWPWPLVRALLAVALVCIVVAVVLTFRWVYPINRVLFEQPAGSRPAVLTAKLAARWIALDRLRFAIVSVAFAALLWAWRVAPS
jgi:hypothetical protein